MLRNARDLFPAALDNLTRLGAIKAARVVAEAGHRQEAKTMLLAAYRKDAGPRARPQVVEPLETVPCSCGHTTVITFVGDRAAYEQHKDDWRRRGKCDLCQAEAAKVTKARTMVQMP